MKKLLLIAGLMIAAASASAASTYVGGSAGYLVDSQEAYFAARVGFDVAKANTLTHSVEAEVGFASDSAGPVTLDIVPVMVNYRFTSEFADSKFGVYGGAGAGASHLRVWAWGNSDNSWSFTAQAFAGIEYRATAKVSLLVGARYIWIDDVRLLGINAEVGDDVSLEAGLNVRF